MQIHFRHTLVEHRTRMYDVQPQLHNSSSTSTTIARLLRLESMPYYGTNRSSILAVIDDMFQYYTRWPRVVLE